MNRALLHYLRDDSMLIEQALPQNISCVAPAIPCPNPALMLCIGFVIGAWLMFVLLMLTKGWGNPNRFDGDDMQ